MKKFYFLFLSFISIFIFTSLTFGQNPNSSNGIQTNIINTTSSSTTVEFILNRYDQTTVDVNGISTVFYKIPGSIWLMEKGNPQLPTNRASIIIPDLAGMNFRIISQEFQTISTIKVMPSKGHLTRDIDPSTVPYTFNNIYTQDVWYPENNILLDSPYIVRELRGQTIQFNPMQYNPAQGKLKICTRIVVEVYADPAAVIVNPLMRQKPFTGVSREFIDVYKSLFINYGTTNYDYVPLDETGRLLIIYPTAFASNVTPFYDWKVEKGMTTLLAEYPTQTGTGAAAIKNYIQNLYNSPEGLTFIVLVGEANQIPTMNGTYEGAPSDPCYVKLEGTDAYPDAYISRISPTSSANLDYILYKFIKYEKYPDSGPGAGWYLKATGVASNEDGGTGTYDWERMNLLRDMLIENMFFTTVDQIYDPGATAAQVTNALNDGRSIVNYIGHGSGTSWGTTGYSNSNIYSLSNDYMNPFVLDVACDNGDFTMSECMEEAWVRAGSTSDPKGAIAAFGASTLASWVPPCDMQYHAMFLLTTREKQTVGGVCFNGIMHGMDLWGGSSGEGLKMMEQFNIMGDCSMMLTLGMEPDSTAPEQITDLAAIDPTSNSITLNWTSPYDSSFGGIVSYDLRYSSNPIVTEEDYNNAQSILISGGPDSTGIPKSYTIHQLAFSTQYYFAIKASDIWGNKSPMSNVPNQSTWDHPEIFISPDSIAHIIVPDTTIVDSIMISNITSVNSTLDYSVELMNNTFPGNVFAKLVPMTKPSDNIYSKGNPDISKGMSIRGSGGPDLFGYEWIDSNDPEGPAYEWNDISTTGTLVTNWTPTSIYTGTDEGKAGPFNLGFNFKFYGEEYSTVYFYSNGFISFVDYDDAFMSNGSIPSSSDPNNIIAAVWDDLDGGSNGHVYYKAEENKYTVQYTNWPGYYGGTGPFTFQIVLYKNGKIMIYYNSVQGSSSSCTVGIENFDGSDGLQVVEDATYLESNLAIQFSSEPEWLIANNLEGTIYNGNSMAIVLNFITEDMELGDYSMDVVVSSNDPDNSEITIPVSMEISEIPVELTSFTAENLKDAIILKWNTASEKNNMGFDIEKRFAGSQPDGQGTFSDWKKIGHVAGNGTTSEPNDYSFKDNNLINGTNQFRLRQIDFNGSVHFSNKIELIVYNIPTEFSLSQNYPNPFNPSTSFRYDIPVQSDVIINIYDGLGRLVRSLVNESKEPGRYTAFWDGRNNENRSIASGLYIYRIKAGNFVSVKKMLMLK